MFLHRSWNCLHAVFVRNLPLNVYFWLVKRAFMFKAPADWNNWPVDIRSAISSLGMLNHAQSSYFEMECSSVITEAVTGYTYCLYPIVFADPLTLYCLSIIGRFGHIVVMFLMFSMFSLVNVCGLSLLSVRCRIDNSISILFIYFVTLLLCSDCDIGSHKNLALSTSIISWFFWKVILTGCLATLLYIAAVRWLTAEALSLNTGPISRNVVHISHWDPKWWENRVQVEKSQS